MLYFGTQRGGIYDIPLRLSRENIVKEDPEDEEEEEDEDQSVSRLALYPIIILYMYPY